MEKNNPSNSPQFISNPNPNSDYQGPWFPVDDIYSHVWLIKSQGEDCWVMSRIRINIQAGFMPNGPLGRYCLVM